MKANLDRDTGRRRALAFAALGVALIVGAIIIVLLLVRGREGQSPAVDIAGGAATGSGSSSAGAPAAGSASGKEEGPGAKEGEAEEDIGPPLLRGRVTGEGSPIAGASVHIFSTMKVIEVLQNLERFAPEGGSLPDVPKIIAGVRAEVDNIRSAAIVARTDAEGAYEFRKILPGGYLVLTVADGWLFRYGDVVSVDRGRTEVLDIALSRGCRIAGRVVDARGSGVPGATVTAEFRPGGMPGIGLIIRRMLRYLNGEFLRGPFQARTGEDGAFALASLPPGLYDVAAEKEGGVEDRVRGVEAGAEEVLLYLGNGAVAAGAFAGSDGGPVQGVRCRLERQDDLVQLPLQAAGFNDLANSVNRMIGDPPRMKESGPKGEFRFGPLSPGKYRLTVEQTGFLGFTREFDLDWDQYLDLGTLRIERGEAIEGVVRAEDGTPLEGAKVLATQAEMNFFNIGMVLNDYLSSRTVTAADAAGRFRLAGLLKGTYRLTASYPGFAPEMKADAKTGGEPVEFTLRRGGRVTGRVVEAGSGDPIAGARVEAGGARARTGDDGTFALEGVVPDDPSRNPFQMQGMPAPAAGEQGGKKLTTSASATGYLGGSQEADFSQGAAEVEIELEKAPEIAGTVVDPDGQPAPGALVRLTPSFNMPPGFDFLDPSLIFLTVGVTGLDGTFKLRSFVGGESGAKYRVIADHILHARGASEQFLLKEAPESVDVRLQKASRIHGTVTDGRNPVTGTTVRLSKAPKPASGGAGNADQMSMVFSMLGLPKGGETTYAGREGTFEYGKVLPGDYLLSAEMAGYVDSKPQSVTIAAGDEREVALVVDPGKEISGTAVDPSGAPVENARIRLLQEKGEKADQQLFLAQKFFGSSFRSGRAGEDGSFRIPGLPRGTYTVIAEAPGFSRFEKAAVEAGEKNLRVVLIPSATLRGLVLDAATRAPVPRFRVQIARLEEAAADPLAMFGRDVTDAEGRFARDDLEGGKSRVTVSAHGYASARNDVVLSPGAAVESQFLLAAAGSIRGTVVEKESRLPIPGARIGFIRYEPASRDEKASAASEGKKDPKAEDARAMGTIFGAGMLMDEAFASGDGEFLLEGVPEGPQTIVAAHQDFISDFREGVEVRLGEEIEIPFELRRGLSISGRLRQPERAGAKVRMVMVRGAEEANARAMKDAFTSEEGEFRVGGLDAGRYRIVVPAGDGRAAPEPIEIDLKKDESGIEIRMP